MAVCINEFVFNKVFNMYGDRTSGRHALSPVHRSPAASFVVEYLRLSRTNPSANPITLAL